MSSYITTSFPRVLIFDQTFNNFSGGGITLTNLFKGWPIESISVVSTVQMMDNISFDVCNKYYQLGTEEHKFVFPLNLMQRYSPSGLKTISPESGLPFSSVKPGLRRKLVNQFFLPFMNWIGLFYYLSKISLSQKFKDWLNEFRPEILYLQVTTRDGLLFAKALCDYLKIPVTIHVMDDWPTTISNKGLFKNYWRRKIDKEFRELLDKVDVHLSICDAMSEEYEKRYNKSFIAFHNPIELNAWLQYTKQSFSLNKKDVCILYTGRVGIGIGDSLLEAAAAIDSMNYEDVNIKLHIQTPSKHINILDLLKNFKCVVINPYVEYSQIPEITSKADILLLANDFNEGGIDFLKFSMPTKASEYMISGTPVLVYASGQTAVSKFFSRHDCGLCVTNQKSEELKKAIWFLIGDEEYRKKISRNAVNLAREKFNAENVRNEFQHLLINSLKQ